MKISHSMSEQAALLFRVHWHTPSIIFTYAKEILYTLLLKIKQNSGFDSVPSLLFLGLLAQLHITKCWSPCFCLPCFTNSSIISSTRMAAVLHIKRQLKIVAQREQRTLPAGDRRTVFVPSKRCNRK